MPPKGKFQAQAGRAKCGPFRCLCHCPPQTPNLTRPCYAALPSSVAFCLFALLLAAASANFERVFCPFLIFILIITSIILKIKQAATLGIPPDTSSNSRQGQTSRQRQLLLFMPLVACHLPPVFDTLLPRSPPSLVCVCVCVGVLSYFTPISILI